MNLEKRFDELEQTVGALLECLGEVKDARRLPVRLWGVCCDARACVLMYVMCAMCVCVCVCVCVSVCVSCVCVCAIT